MSETAVDDAEPEFYTYKPERIPDSRLDWPRLERLAEASVLFDLAARTELVSPWEAANAMFNKIEEDAHVA